MPLGNPIADIVGSPVGSPIALPYQGGSPVPFVPSFVLLNGSNESFRSNELTRTPLGGGTNDIFTCSMMVRPDALIAASTYFAVRGNNPEPFTVRLKERGASGFKLDIRIDGATAKIDSYNDITPLVATNLYHFHIAADFSAGKTDLVIKVNGDAGTPTPQSASVTGAFAFSHNALGFGGSDGAVPNNLLNGCIGQLYFKQGVYEPDSTLFAPAEAAPTPTDWSLLDGALASPELLVMNWRNTSGTGTAREVVNSGTSGNLNGGVLIDIYKPSLGTINPCT